jgi:hypothetical protein
MVYRRIGWGCFLLKILRFGNGLCSLPSRLLYQVRSGKRQGNIIGYWNNWNLPPQEFIQYLYIARGSLFEVITLLVIVEKLGWIDDKDLETFRNEAEIIGKMLSNLVTSLKNQLH